MSHLSLFISLQIVTFYIYTYDTCAKQARPRTLL